MTNKNIEHNDRVRNSGSGGSKGKSKRRGGGEKKKGGRAQGARDLVGKSIDEYEEKIQGDVEAKNEYERQEIRDEQQKLEDLYSCSNMLFRVRKEMFGGQHDGEVVFAHRPQEHDLVITTHGMRYHVFDRRQGVSGYFYPLLKDDHVLAFDKLRRFVLVKPRVRDNYGEVVTTINLIELENDAKTVIKSNVHLFQTEKSLNLQYAINICTMSLRSRYNDDIVVSSVVAKLIRSDIFIKELEDYWNGMDKVADRFISIDRTISKIKYGFEGDKRWWLIGFIVLFNILFFDIMILIPSLFILYNFGGRDMRKGLNLKPANFLSAISMELPQTCVKLYRPMEFPLQIGTKLTIRKPCRCEEKTEYTQVVGALIEGSQVVVPTQCSSNTYAATAIRALFPREWDEEENSKFSRFFRNFCIKNIGLKGLVFQMMSLDEWLDESTYTISQKEELRLGFEDQLIEEYLKAGMFVKKETYGGKCPENMKPRKIETRTVQVLARLGPYFKSATKMLKKIFKYDSPYYYGSGSDDTINTWFSTFSKGYAYEIDYSNWDGSMTPWDLQNEIWFIENICSEVPPDWEIFRKHWKKNKASGKGVTYESYFGRRSGDAYTSFFNTLFNIVLSAYLIATATAIVGCGDDGVVFSSDQIPVDEIVDKAGRLGRKIEIAIKPIWNVEFCSGKFWMVDGEWKFGMKPFRQLCKFGVNHSSLGPSKIPRYLKGIAESQQCLAKHVPIYGPFLDRINEIFKNRKAYFVDDSWTYKISSKVCKNIGEDTRAQFELIYGITIAEQLEIEQSFSQIGEDSFPLLFTSSVIKRGYEVDVGQLIPEFSKIARVVLKEEKVSKKTTTISYVLLFNLIAACFEEIIRWRFPVVTTMILSISEGLLVSPINFFLHLLFYKAGYYSIVLHLMYNYMTTKPANIIMVLLKFAFEIMTKKKNNNSRRPQGKSGNRKKNRKTKQQKQQTVKSVLGQLIKAAGTGIGGVLGGPTGATLGGAAASLFNNITGMGDYEIKSNSILTENSPVTMHSDDGKVRVKHTEFITTIESSTDFQTRTFNINPGLSTTFPWLSNLSQGFQTYSIKGMVVMYKPLSAMAVGSTNTSLGAVIVATQYDVDQDVFYSRREMESYMYTTSGVPFEHQIHPVECKPSSKVLEEQYVRYGAVTQDKRWNDLGKFTIATQGMQAAGHEIGELWISYDIELCKPRMIPLGYGTAQYSHLQFGAYTNTNILGSIQLDPVGTLEVETSATGAGWDTINLPGELYEGIFLVLAAWRGISTPGLALTATLTNAVQLNYFELDTEDFIGNTGTTSTRFMYAFTFKITGRNSNIVFSAATLPTAGSYGDVFITQIGHEGEAALLALSDNYRHSYIAEEEDEKIYDMTDSQIIRSYRKGKFC